MTARPILFSGAMVRAILDGRKTQTRRLVTKGTSRMGSSRFDDVDIAQATRSGPTTLKAPYGGDHLGFEGTRHRVYSRIEPGDTLWVRETFYCDDFDYPNAPVEEMRPLLDFRADHDCRNWEAGCPCDDEGRSSWRPSIHMPRWASRITLRVTDVHVERLQDITTNDIVAEGIGVPDAHADRDTFARHKWRALWQSINAKRAPWASDPWVWVVEFEQEGE